MKFLDKLGLVVFSTLILIIAVIVCALVAGWMNVQIAIDGIKYIVANDVPSKITIAVSVILGLLAIKCIFFNSFSKGEDIGKDSILLESENGKLLVSRDTIENLANTVAKDFDNADNVITKVKLDETNTVSIFLTLFVRPDTVIKDLASKLQIEIKKAIKNSIDLDVKEVNIRIKDVAVKKESTSKKPE